MNESNVYNSNIESKKTLQTMKNNFAHWYDSDPTSDQIANFENNRKKQIKMNYLDSLKLRNIEEKTRELISPDPEIQRILEEIHEYHWWQVRRFNDIPYVDHPISVAKIISRNFLDKELIEAWLLHDVIEDVPNWREIMKWYSETIYSLVDSVTEQDRSLPRKERKIAYISHIESYDYKSLAISLSDRIQNLRDMIVLYETYWDEIWSRFHAWPDGQKWFILSYSMKVKEQIDKIEDEKIREKLLDLYNELSILIWYFLELID